MSRIMLLGLAALLYSGLAVASVSEITDVSAEDLKKAEMLAQEAGKQYDSMPKLEFMRVCNSYFEDVYQIGMTGKVSENVELYRQLELMDTAEPLPYRLFKRLNEIKLRQKKTP